MRNMPADSNKVSDVSNGYKKCVPESLKKPKPSEFSQSKSNFFRTIRRQASRHMSEWMYSSSDAENSKLHKTDYLQINSHDMIIEKYDMKNY